MGILDDLKHNLEKLGDKAKEGFDGAKDKAGDLVDDAKDRIGHSDDAGEPSDESSEVGPDSSSTDAVQPGYVTAEDDADDPESGEDTLDDDGDDPADADADSVETEPAVETDVDPYDQPLTESIGDEIAAATVNSEAVAEAVDSTSTERESAD